MANYIDNTSLSQTLTYLKKYIDDIANTKQNSLNRTIWGASDTGGDISGNMFVGDSTKINNYLEYANNVLNYHGNVFITGGNAATKDYVNTAINAIQIGGRNLFGYNKGIGPGFAPAFGMDAANNGFWFDTPSSAICLRLSNLGFNGIGGSFTVSGYIKASAATTACALNLCDYGPVSGGNVPITTSYTYFSRTFSDVQNYITPNDYNGFLDFELLTPGVRISLKDFKIERGTKATTYTPAPEDIDASIASAITTAEGDAALKYLKLTGGTITGNLTVNSGVITGSLKGNASTATKLATARTIWGQSFDGSADINGNIIFPVITTGSASGITWSGSTDGASIYYRLDAADAGRLVLNLSDDSNTLISFALNGTDFANINTNGVFSGTAVNATKLQTTRSIWGQSFDGSGNVDGNLTITASYNNSLILSRGSNSSWSIINSPTSGEGNFHIQNNYSGRAVPYFDVLTLAYSTGNAVFKGTVTSPTFIGALKGNADSATKLQTPRTIWGQNFDGSRDVNGGIMAKVLNPNSVEYALTLRNTFNNNVTTPYGVGIKFGLSDDADGAGKYMYINTINASIFGNAQKMVFGSYATDQIMSLDGSTGNVGIGTTSPGYKLDVNGDGNFNGSLNTGLLNVNVNNTWLSPSKMQIGRIDANVYTDKACIGVTDGNLHLDSYQGKYIYLNYYVNGNTPDNAVAITNTGSLCVGTVSDAYKLFVNGNAHFSGPVDFGNNISVPRQGGTWIGGMQRASIVYNNLNAIPTDSWESFFSIKTLNGNVVSYGAIENIVGFTTYNANRTANGYDYRFCVDTTTGQWFVNGQEILNAGNYNNYVPKLDGTGATGTWNITTGNSDKLEGFGEASFLRERGNWADGANARDGLSVTGWSSRVNYQTDYGDSLHIQGFSSWYNRLDFGTNGRIYFYQAINPSTLTGCMQYKGALAYLTDTVAAATKVIALIPANSQDDLVYADIGGNDYFRIRAGSASDGGWYEIATADDGNEPIYARQYTGAFANIARTLTLLDKNGNTNIPGSLYVDGTIYTNVGLHSRNICIETDRNGQGVSKYGEINNYTGILYLQYSSSKDLLCCAGGGNVGIGAISPSYKLYVSGDGRFSSSLTAQSFITSSDRNLKENILYLNSDYLNKVESVEFREFNFKDDKSKTKHYGVIAQDLQELGLDDLVQKDLKGNLGVDYISLLILEIKSLKDKLNKLEKKLN